MKLQLKRKWKKISRLSWSRMAALASISLLLLLFQNCGPVGTTGNVDENSANNGLDGLVGGEGNNTAGSNDNSTGTNPGTTTPPGTTSPPGTTTPPVITSNPPPPNPTSVSMSTNTTTSLSLNWTSGGGSTVGFRVVYQEGTTAPANCSTNAMSVNGTIAAVTNLKRARQYSFRVCAINGNTTPDISSGAIFTTGTRCFQNVAPTITQNSFASFSFPMGMGPLSGTAKNIAPVVVNGSNSGGPYDQNQTYSLVCTTSPANILDVNCAGNNGTNFTNNAVSVTFNQEANNQCPATGPVTVSLVAQDECGAESPAKSIVVNVTNECLPENKISAIEKSQNDQFGSQVAVEGNYAVAIETGDNEGGQDSGAASVYFYDGSNWTFQQKLIPTESAMSDNMKSVAISGNRIVVGSPYHLTAGVGAVFIFERSGSTWTQTAKITPSEPNVQDVGDLFGYSVALLGTRLVVGAPHDNNVETSGSKLAYAGAVYVYNLSGSTWVQDGEKVVVSGNTGRNEFGASVALASGFIVVGAPHNETFRSNGTGKVYVLTKSGANWTSSQTLQSSNKKNGDMFGLAVATDGTRIAVGAPFATGRSGQSSAGSAYIFENSGGWSQSAAVVASDGNNSDRFGTSVSIISADLIVGAPWNETKTGAAYHYQYSGSTWTQAFKIMARDRSTNDEFGGSVSLSNRRAFVGSRLDDGAVENVGSAYVLDLK